MKKIGILSASHADEVRSLKEALHRTIHTHPTLSVQAIAEELDMSASYLYKAALPDTDTAGPDATGVRFPLKKLTALTRITNDFTVLDYIERMVGRVAFPLPPANTGLQELHEAATEAIAEFGDVMRVYGEAVADKRITSEELDNFEVEAHEAIQAICNLLVGMRGAAK